MSAGGFVGCGHWWCSGRLTGHLDILRLMTLGLARSRRSSRGRSLTRGGHGEAERITRGDPCQWPGRWHPEG